MSPPHSAKRNWSPEEVQSWYRDTNAFTYCNPADRNLAVRKPNRRGLTVNWANPMAWLLLALILILVFATVRLLK